MFKPTIYKTLEDFDAFICTVGRVQVPIGAEFIWMYKIIFK